MRDGLLGALIRGDKVMWALIGALWLAAAVLVGLRRSSRRQGAPATPIRIFGLLAATSLLSILALPLASAVAIPRIRWKNVDAPDLSAPSGETWRRLRGPVVPILDRGALDVAIPTIDAQGNWVLVGLISGRPALGLGPAPVAPLEAGGPRICRSDGESCRPWPAAWPDPSRPIGTGELVWSKQPAEGALAYDTETGYFLEAIVGVSEADGPSLSAPPGVMFAGVLELAGRIANDPPREGTTVLFVLRSVAQDRLHAVRVVSVASAGGHSFHLQRSDVSLTTGPRMIRWFARPLLLFTSLAFPLGVLVALIARSRRRRRGLASVSPWTAELLESLSAIATLAAGVAAGAPAVVAIASLWGSR